MMQQLNIFEYGDKPKRILSLQADKIQEFFIKNSFGENNKISMTVLAKKFNIKQRELRNLITEIRLYGSIYVKSQNGYWGVVRKDIMKDDILLKRTLNSIERMVIIDPNLFSLFYSKLNELKRELR